MSIQPRWISFHENNPSAPTLPEVEYERWIARNLLDVLGPRAWLIGRQVRLASGRVVDILAADNRGLIVIEVKAERIDRAAVCQILEYMGELADTPRYEDGAVVLDRDYAVRGIVAAPSMTVRAATMLRHNVGVSHLRLDLAIKAQPVTSEAMLWSEGADRTDALDVVPADDPLAARLSRIRRERFVDHLMENYRFELRGEHLFGCWPGHEHVDDDELVKVIRAIRIRLLVAHPGRHNLRALAP